jgi:CBS domain-containing protein
MKARDVMVSPVVTVQQSATVSETAKTLVERGISAVPVVDAQGRIVGIVSEGDLLHRVEAGTGRQRSRWLSAIANEETLAADYVKAHARRVVDIMTRNVVTATPDTPLHEIARAMERHSIKRLPIVENGALVGIVSRANLVQAVASARADLEMPRSDKAIRDRLLAELNAQRWAHTGLLNVTVTNGIVDLWGFTSSDVERRAVRVAAETAPGVSAVNDHLVTRQAQAWY